MQELTGFTPDSLPQRVQDLRYLQLQTLIPNMHLVLIGATPLNSF